jgi:hypothetical protein
MISDDLGADRSIYGGRFKRRKLFRMYDLIPPTQPSPCSGCLCVVGGRRVLTFLDSGFS